MLEGQEAKRELGFCACVLQDLRKVLQVETSFSGMVSDDCAVSVNRVADPVSSLAVNHLACVVQQLDITDITPFFGGCDPSHGKVLHVPHTPLLLVAQVVAGFVCCAPQEPCVSTTEVLLLQPRAFSIFQHWQVFRQNGHHQGFGQGICCPRDGLQLLLGRFFFDCSSEAVRLFRGF